MDPDATPIPEWAVVMLDGIHFGKAICWGQPEQDLERNKEYWTGYSKFKGCCVQWDTFPGPAAVIFWVVCCPMAVWWAQLACCGEELDTTLTNRVEPNMKACWILYPRHLVYLCNLRKTVFYLDNIPGVKGVDDYEAHLRSGVLGFFYKCFAGAWSMVQGLCVGSHPLSFTPHPSPFSPHPSPLTPKQP